ncbi:hypothetical protein SISSUDRAFT_1055653 [Sistotremastrum suecicum HHB10207 ss-3]|uniref:Uncharacterized protein n=1 Tax=Sistotremastrum suecicum HHB10207 ss-3 TaxID=1314776 RepID=A0A165XM67_9AGAM|nr:hypothetical protein SISSUDRAFT_1055653 [Sistotremastrum suecicum HHB10207 ss-3]
MLFEEKTRVLRHLRLLVPTSITGSISFILTILDNSGPGSPTYPLLWSSLSQQTFVRNVFDIFWNTFFTSHPSRQGFLPCLPSTNAKAQINGRVIVTQPKSFIYRALYSFSRTPSPRPSPEK